MDEPDRSTVVGVALAGGASTRMGRDKTTMPWHPDGADGADYPALSQELPLWRHAVERLRRVTGDVVLADGGRGLSPLSVTDGPGRGPVAGILGAAAARPGRDLLVLAVDLPLIPEALLRHLLYLANSGAAAAAASNAAWIVPKRARGLECLCAVYRIAALDVLRERVAAGTFDLYGLAERKVAMHTIDDAELRAFGDAEQMFLNVNRPADWRRARTAALT